MKIIFTYILTLLICSLSAQSFHLQMTVKNLPVKEVYLANFYGERNNIIDTAMPDKNGKFDFFFKQDDYPGLYRIFLDKKIFFDLIYNNEDIRVITDFNFPYDSLKVISSKENNIYYDFLRTGNNYRRKFDLLAPLNNYYPQNDTFYQSVRIKYIAVQTGFLKYVEDIISANPDSWATKIIRQKKPLFYEPVLDESGRKQYATDHYFDNIDFTDVELIRSDVFTSVAIEYMSLYSNPNLSQAELENEFIIAVDKIMAEAMENSIVYEFIVDYLVKGFERFHFDKVLDYIAEHYSPQSCENEERKTDLQTRLEKYAELSEGRPAPEFDIQDKEGRMINLTRIKSEYTLVLFWASWCPHCGETLPEIDKIYQKTGRAKMEIVAISLDKEKAEWEKALNEKNYSWINCCDFKGWESKAAVDYNVYATPTMFLLDNDKKIVAKPITLSELKDDLVKAGIAETVQ